MLSKRRRFEYRRLAILPCALLSVGCADTIDGTDQGVTAVKRSEILGGVEVSSIGFSVEVGGCSGVAIHPRAILTAGHCYQTSWNRMTNTFVRATIDSYGQTGQVFNGNALWTTRPGYNESTATDLAIVILPTAMSNVIPITMWNGALSVGDPLWIYGWGLPNDDHYYGNLPGIAGAWSTRVVINNEPTNWPRPCGGDSGGAWTTYSPQRVFGVSSHSGEHDSNDCSTVGGSLGWSDAHRLSASMDFIRSFFVFLRDPLIPSRKS